MKGRRLSAAQMAVRREEMLDTAYRMFTEHNIDSVSMSDIAAESDYTLRSFQRYFRSKENLVIEVAAREWKRFLSGNSKRRPKKGATAAVSYAYFLDSFLTAYSKRRDLLRFNQFFNVFIQSQHISTEQIQPYQDIAEELRAWFHGVYVKGGEDGTLRTDIPEAEIFNTTLHLMLAAVTRYAVGLVYTKGSDTGSELATLREMLLRQYTV